MVRKKKIRWVVVPSGMSMSTPGGIPKTHTIGAGHRRLKKRKKSKKYSLIGSAKETRRVAKPMYGTLKKFKLRHLQRKRKTIYY